MGSNIGRRAFAGGLGSNVGEGVFGVALNDCRRKPRCLERFDVCTGGEYRECECHRAEWRRTAASASARIFFDFSCSFLSCVASAISEARSRRFSTYRVDISVWSSSIRTLRVELSLAARWGLSVALGDEIRAYLVMCLFASKNFFLTASR